MKLSDLTNELQDKRLTGDAEIFSLCTDSRIATEGDLFFCFCGGNIDSHDCAEEAVRRGASAVVCERELNLDCPQVIVKDGRETMARLAAAFYHHPERSMKIVGITGTNGKTTVSHMLVSILNEAGMSAGLIGTLGAKFGKKTIAPDLTTPDPVSLFSLLSDMKREGVEVAVLEISAHALALKKECPIVYEVGIFTNLTQDHLDFFKTMKEYGDAKRRMFDASRCKFAALNSDDAFYKILKEQGVPTMSYGLENPADAFAVILNETVRGSKVLINLNDELIEASLNMTGRHNVQNALAAAVAAKRLGADADAIAHGLNKVKGVDGRLEWIANYRGADIFTDFAHTPDGLQKSLLALRKHCKGKLYCLFGCGGNRDKTKRPIMGATVARGCNYAVITSDNPRFEDPCAIIADIEAGYRPVSPHYVAIEERERATEYALELLGSGDILLIAGKGGETYQEIMGIKYSYNDKDVVTKILGKKQE